MPVFKAKNGKVFRDSLSAVNSAKFGPVDVTGTNEINSGYYWPAPSDDVTLVSAAPYFKPYVAFEDEVVLDADAEADFVEYVVPEVDTHANYTVSFGDTPIEFLINSVDAPVVTAKGFKFDGGLVGRIYFPKPDSDTTVKVTIARTDCILTETVINVDTGE